MLKNFLYSFILISILFTILANLIYFINYSNNNLENPTNPFSYYIPEENNLFWPVPGYHTITSNFGERISPITKTASFHHGIDISALEGAFLYSAGDGKVSFIGYSGANGYSIHISSQNLTFIYGHVSPNYIVNIGDIIAKGQIIGNVGPKYVTDSRRNPYKWFYYRPSFAFWNKKRRQKCRQSSRLFLITYRHQKLPNQVLLYYCILDIQAQELNDLFVP